MPRVEEREIAIAYRLIGRMDDFEALRELLVEWPGLTVLSSDPWSGASQLLNAVADHLGKHCVLVDARSCSSPLDLAVEIADSAVGKFQPDATPWWLGSDPTPNRAALRMARALDARHIAIDALRRGAGPGLDRCADAMGLLLALVDGKVSLLIDHAGLLLSALAPGDARELLGLFRSLAQQHPQLDLVLVEHRGGPASAALSDSEHPMFRAGTAIPLRRPKPVRFALDLRALKLEDDPTFRLLPAASALTHGVPALAWQVVALASAAETPAEQVADGWARLRQITEASVAREWDLLRRVHPLAQTLVAAMSCGLRPHAVSANSKSVNDALRRLRDLGMAWQPGERSWVLSDPLLKAWARDHAPPWAARQRDAAG